VLLVAVVVGTAIGVFSILADGIIPGRLFTLLGNIAAPWALAAFVVGYRATSPRQGAIAGALALVLGVATYYAGTAVRGYVVGELNVVWTVVALVAGPVIGACGAAISTRREHPPLVAVVLPGAMFIAEGLFLVYDRKFWRTNFGAETYRLIDVGVALALVLGGFALAWVFVERSRRGSALLGVAGVGLVGAFGFVLLERIIVALV
jgi:NAD/NADP transhydrogenase beta subunit